MNKLLRNKILVGLIIITLIGFIIRIYDLGKVPISADWDEAALGYNAYSILQTGRDEYGTFLPVILRSFGDYKPALYSYILIPFIQLFGLSTFSVRLPSAIFGTLTIVVTYFLVQELLKYKNKSNSSSLLPLLSSFVLALSPVAIHFSRIAFEANIGVFLNSVMVLTFLMSFQKPKLIFLSITSAALGPYVYQSEKVFVPLLLVSLILIFRKDLLSIGKKYVIGSLLLGIFIILPLVVYSLSHPESFARLQAVSRLSSDNKVLTKSIERLQLDYERNDVVGMLFDNRRVVYATVLFENYISHFNLNWLFIEGDKIERHHTPFMGNLYVVELPLLLLGLYYFLFFKLDKKVKIFILFWFLAVPIPAMPTTDVPHTVRTLNFLPLLQIFIACGILFLIQLFRPYRMTALVIGSIYCLLFVLNVSYYLNQYFVEQNREYAMYWQFGYKEAMVEAKKIRQQGKRAFLSENFEQPYIFYLFYTKADPRRYLEEKGSNRIWNDCFTIDDIHFGRCDVYMRSGDIYITPTQDAIPSRKIIIPPYIKNTKEIQTVYFPNGKKAVTFHEVL